MNEKDFETVMEAVCDICHWPSVEKSEEALNVHCEDCPVEKILKTVGLDQSEDLRKDSSEKEIEKPLRDEGKGRVPCRKRSRERISAFRDKAGTDSYRLYTLGKD